MSNWLWTSGTAALGVVVSALGIYTALLLATRLLGLRSFSKLSSFDFAVTVALGSLVAATLLTPSPPLLQALVGLATLFVIQGTVSYVRRNWAWAQHLIDNEPLLLMAGEDILEDHLDEALVTQDDLRNKLRVAGVTHRSQVFAVVMETTGDISVVKRSDQVDLDIFRNVRGVELLEGVHEG